MLKKIIIGILVITVVGAGGAALAYNLNNPDAAEVTTGPSPLASNADESTEQAPQEQTPQVETTPQSKSVTQVMEGEAWQATGTIVAVDDYGFDFTTESGEIVYIELGPPDYWQSQGVDLVVGETVTVDGAINEGMIHASTVETADAQVLAVRSESGQPLWSGGTDNSQGQNDQSTGSADGDHVPDPQAQVDEWVTIEGTLISFQGGNMTMSTADGSIVSFQTGQPRFFAEQGITFQVGDQISVLGFYEGEQFSAGEITQLSTGLRVMLRDPNGRPLWAGPGSNGNGSSGNGGSGNGNSSNGNGNGGNGNSSSRGNGGNQG
jgi:hypothetical protein